MVNNCVKKFTTDKTLRSYSKSVFGVEDEQAHTQPPVSEIIKANSHASSFLSYLDSVEGWDKCTINQAAAGGIYAYYKEDQFIIHSIYSSVRNYSFEITYPID